jgi:queuine tRNA-ribosyltransferase
LFHVEEMLGPTLLSLHNLSFYLRLMVESRQAIAERRFASFRAACLARYARSA